MLKLSSNIKIFVVRYFHTLKKSRVPISRQIHNFAHQKLLGKYLFLTNTISSGVLMSFGDCIQQQIEFYKKVHKGEKYDWNRTMNMTIVGLVLGPVQHFFYKYIDFILPKRTFQSVCKKILLDQIIASPSAICIFFFGLGFLEDGNFKAAQNEIKQKFLTIYVMDWLIWPPTQYLNFAYLSTKYRVVYVNFITMLYDVFLSYVKYENKNFHYSQFLRLPRWDIKYATSPLVLAEAACQAAQGSPSLSHARVKRSAWTEDSVRKRSQKRMEKSKWKMFHSYFSQCCTNTTLHGFRYLVDPTCSKFQRQHQLDFANYFCGNTQIGQTFHKHLNGSVLEEMIQERKKYCAEEFPQIQWQRVRLVPPCRFLQPVISWHGQCQTFNMVSLEKYLKPPYSHMFPSIYSNSEGSADESGSKEEVYSPTTNPEELHWSRDINSTPWRTSEPSPSGGAMFTLNFRSHDFDDTCSLGDKSFVVAVHSPTELPDFNHQYHVVRANSIVLITVIPELLVASSSLQTLPPSRRGCYLPQEKFLHFFTVYNERNCQLECHANITLKHCGCVAFYHPRGVDTPVCGLDLNLCVIKMGYNIGEKCSCLPICSDITYSTAITFINKKRPIHHAADLAYVFIMFPKKGVISKVAESITGQLEVLSNLGGLLCLFLGASMVSLLEMLYMLSLRPLVVFWNYRRRTNKPPRQSLSNPAIGLQWLR